MLLTEVWGLSVESRRRLLERHLQRGRTAASRHRAPQQLAGSREALLKPVRLTSESIVRSARVRVLRAESRTDG